MNTIIRRFFKLKTNLKRIPNPKATKKVILPTGLVVTTKLIRGIYLIDVEHVKAQR